MNPRLVKFRNDRIFREGTFPEMRSEYVADVAPEPVARKTEFRVRENLVRTDTVSAVLSFPGRRVCALNFANANVPGGAYVFGGNAQEEALCRATLLYYPLRTARGFYRRNRLHVLPDYTHGMVYSENVPVVRDRDGRSGRCWRGSPWGWSWRWPRAGSSTGTAALRITKASGPP